MLNAIYFLAVLVFISGLFIMITSDSYIRKVIGLIVFQNSVLIFYIALGKVRGGIVPIDLCANIHPCAHNFTSPLPHVLMLTAIVVGFATMSVALALNYQMYQRFGSISETWICQNVLSNGND